MPSSVMKDAPGVRLRFVARQTRDAAGLRDGSVDLETGEVAATTSPELRQVLLFADRMVGVVRAGHTLRKGRVTSAQYAAAAHLGISPACRHEHLRIAIRAAVDHGVDALASGHARRSCTRLAARMCAKDRWGSKPPVLEGSVKAFRGVVARGPTVPRRPRPGASRNAAAAWYSVSEAHSLSHRVPREVCPGRLQRPGRMVNLEPIGCSAVVQVVQAVAFRQEVSRCGERTCVRSTQETPRSTAARAHLWAPRWSCETERCRSTQRHRTGRA